MDLHDSDRLLEALEPLDPPESVRDALRRSGELADGVRGEHLAGPRERAEARGTVESAAAEAALDRGRLPCVEADPDRPGELLLLDDPLELEPEAQCPPRRVEYDEGLVAAQLLQRAAVLGRKPLDDRRELLRQRGCGLVALLARVRRVAADVDEQERTDARRSGTRRLRRGKRLSVKSCPCGLGQPATGGVAQVALLGERRGDHRVERVRQLRPSLADGRRRVVHVREQRRNLVLALVRTFSGQALVEDAAERVDVDATVHRLPLDLLRCQVVDGAEDLPAAGEARDGRGVLGQSEVAEIRVLAAAGRPRDQDVRRLDVAMDEPARMGGVERGRDLAEEADGAFRVEAPETLQEA